MDGGLRVQAFAEAAPFYLRSAEAEVEPAHTWYRHYELAAEKSRGLDHQEDHLHAATFHAELRTGESVTLVASTDPAARPGWDGGASGAILPRPHAPGIVASKHIPKSRAMARVDQAVGSCRGPVRRRRGLLAMFPKPSR